MGIVLDVIVIGAGPAGYVAALEVAKLAKESGQKNFKIMCVDEMNRNGGVCLQQGCIPSKFLLHKSHQFYEAKNNFFSSAIKVSDVSVDMKKLLAEKQSVLDNLSKGIDFLFSRAEIEYRNDTNARILSRDKGVYQVCLKDSSGSNAIEAKNVIIACGSKPIDIPGLEVDEKDTLSSTGALSLDAIPKKMLVVGGGVIGIEMASVYSQFGAEVTVVEGSDAILPSFDSDISTLMTTVLKKQGVKILLGKFVNERQKTGNTYKVVYSDGTEDTGFDKILVSVGRVPINPKSFTDIDVKVSERGFLDVDQDFHVLDDNSNILPGVFAIGDVIGGAMLAHKAEIEGKAVARVLLGLKGAYVGLVPSVVYTYPEIASLGWTEKELKASNIPFLVGKVPFTANGRAQAMGVTNGFVKVLATKGDKTVLGVHIVGYNAAAILSEMYVVLDKRMSVHDVVHVCHSHPDFNESIRDACELIINK